MVPVGRRLAKWAVLCSARSEKDGVGGLLGGFGVPGVLVLPSCAAGSEVQVLRLSLADMFGT